MLYLQRCLSEDLRVVTHVDGTARVQVVHSERSPRLHQLLTAFGESTGAGVLCNTSLNFNGFGFINRSSDLLRFCDDRGIDNIVIDDLWLRRQ